MLDYGMESITLNRKQQRRVEVLTRLASGSITRQEAAELLGVSYRHTKRMLMDFKSSGMASVVHGNAGRAPVNRTADDAVERIIDLTREGGKYHGFNTCHLTEMLGDEEGITIGRSTLDRTLRDNHIIVSGRRRIEHRKRRERSGAEGPPQAGR